MGIPDELQKLDELHRGGRLTDEEFTRAKSRLLDSPTASAPPTIIAGSTLPVSLIEEQLADIRLQNELAQIDREWEIERRRYELVARKGQVFVPTVGAGIATAVIGGLFGFLWTYITWWIASPIVGLGYDSPWIITTLRYLPLFGVLWAVYAILTGIYYCIVAHNHSSAYRAYRKRRVSVSTN